MLYPCSAILLYSNPSGIDIPYDIFTSSCTSNSSITIKYFFTFLESFMLSFQLLDVFSKSSVALSLS